MLSVLPRLPTVGIRARSLARAKTARGNIPSWLGAVGEWSTVAGSTLSASGVAESGAVTGVFAYSGGFINTTGIYDGTTLRTGTFLCLWGGGHADYGGNEMYAFGPLENNTPAWYKLRDSTSPVPTNVNEDGSGNPVSRHTHGDPQYIAANNEMLTAGGAYRYSDSSGITVAHAFDINWAQCWNVADASLLLSTPSP